MDENQKKKKSNAKKVLLVGLGAAALTAGAIFGAKNKDTISEMCNNFKDAMKSKIFSSSITTEIRQFIVIVEQYQNIDLPIFDEGTPKSRIVNGFIRNLPVGWQASAEKLAEAESLGIILEPGQTWVSDYTKHAVAA